MDDMPLQIDYGTLWSCDKLPSIASLPRSTAARYSL
jgi:hypothetical protein